MLRGMLTLTALDRCGDCICQSLEDLVMGQQFPKTFGQQLRICSRVPLLWHSLHSGESTKSQRCKLDELGSRLYTKLLDLLWFRAP